MTINFAIYNVPPPASGTIQAKPIRTGTAMTEASARAQLQPGEYIILDGVDPATEVVVVNPIGIDPVKVPKVPMSVNGTQISASKTSMLANGTDSVTISPIPNGATCDTVLPADKGITPLGRFTITDGSLVITTTVAGVYTFTIRYGLNLDFVVTINAA